MSFVFCGCGWSTFLTFIVLCCYVVLINCQYAIHKCTLAYSLLVIKKLPYYIQSVICFYYDVCVCIIIIYNYDYYDDDEEEEDYSYYYN